MTTRAVRHYHFTDYLAEDKFAEIFFLFSRDAVASGALETFSDQLPKPKGKAVQRGLFKGGYQSIDDAFLEELDEHRDTLARSFKAKNPALDGDTLTEITQRTLDRLVFLRFLEDKSFETRESVGKFGDKGTVWGDFVAASHRLDGTYNGIVFKKHQLLDTGNLKVDDDAFGAICERLAHVNSPYDFNFIPIHILGSIYERFLGKVIVATDKRARVVEKPEVRKAGGVYYTPEYIVQYIVENSVGKTIAGKSPTQISAMRFADISCGSGSFLLGVYDYLLRYHRDWYNANPEKARKGEVVQNDDGTLRLSLSKKREILVRNIFGVDIDHQAVEVAQLSLYLKLLDEETLASARQYQLEIHEALLPTLSANIVCGNSLIGPEIVEDDLFSEQGYADEEMRKVNPLDFRAAFPKIMEQGGFDVIVGNPPYVNAWDFYESQPKIREFINSGTHYKTADRHWDLYVLFIERALQLTKEGGRCSYIIPYSYALQKYGMRSRELVLRETTVESIADVRKVMVFRDVPVITMIPVWKKAAPPRNHRISIVRPSAESTKRVVEAFLESHTVRQEALLKQHEMMLRLDLSAAAEVLMQKILRKSISLGELCYVNYGAQMSSKKKGQFGKEHVIRAEKEGLSCKPMISGRELFRYKMVSQNRYVDWSYAPQMYGPRWPEFFELPKIMIRDITGTHRIEATYDEAGFYCDHTILCALRKSDVAAWREQTKADIDRSAQYSTRFLAGLVASKMVSAYFYLVLSGEGVRTGGGFHTYPETIRAFPIPNLNLSHEGHKKFHDDVTTQVVAMIDAQSKLAKAVTDKGTEFYVSRVGQLDARIDGLIANFYGFTDDDLRVLDAAVAP